MQFGFLYHTDIHTVLFIRQINFQKLENRIKIFPPHRQPVRIPGTSQYYIHFLVFIQVVFVSRAARLEDMFWYGKMTN